MFRPVFYFLLILVAAAGCSAPRSIIHSGMVTPQKQVKAGGNMVLSVSTETMSRLGKLSSDAVKNISQRDSVYLSNEIDDISAALISYALDPTGPTYDLYLRYGLLKKADIGYKYSSGAHTFDAMYQFLGPAAGQGTESGEGGWYGSAGLQYSWQKTELPGKRYLDRLDPVLDFSAQRKDILLPVVLSYSFGPEERNGHVAFGAVYQHSFIKYNFEPGRLYEQLPDETGIRQMPAMRVNKSYSSFGLFVNGKIGHKYVYLLPALSVYYQNFGSFPLLSGRQAQLKGATIIPSLGLQFWFGNNR